MASVVRHRANTLRTSQHGITFLIREEGIRLRPYYDSRHLVTARVGKLITPPHTSITAADLRNYSYSTTTAAVKAFRAKDLPFYEKAVREILGDHHVSRAEFDMCVSLCYNIGTAGFARSKVAYYIKRGNHRAAAKAFYGWANPPELWNRRNREATRFRIGHW